MLVKKVIYITVFNVLGKVNSGGNQCSKRNYEFLCSLFGEENVFCCIISNEDIPQKNEKISVFRKVEGNRDALFSALYNCKLYYPKDEKRIVEYINSINADLAFFESSILGKLMNHININKKIVFFQNVEQLYAKNKVKHQGIWYWPSYKVSKYNETISVNKADGIICLNYRDQQLISRLYGKEADLQLPITFKDSFDVQKVKKSKFCKEKRLLFVGSLFPPNMDGISWFINDVMPLLPEFKLTVVGKDFEKKKELLQRENVDIVGFTDDLEKYYYSYPVLVMPIRYGDGMKVKTAEAMMYGKTIFATDEALEGYFVDGVDGIYRCNKAQEFAVKIRDFFNSEEIPGYQTSVRNLFLNHYEDNIMYREFEKYIKSVINEV